MTLVRDGYESAFEEIVRRYGKALTRYAAAIVGSHGEDVTQDAFSKALLALRRNDAEIELRPWLFRIVRNTALNDLRDSPPTPELLAEAIAGGESPAEALERREELTDLMQRLQSLPEPQRAAIVMREMEGLSHEEIAAALGVSGGAARQAIHRARQALRNGAGMLIPLPLLKALLAAGTMGTAEVATAGAGGTVGAGVALKAVTATVLVAGAMGAGVAVHDSRHPGNAREPAPASASNHETSTGSATAAPVAALVGDRSRSGGGGHRGRGESEPGDDRGGKGRGPGDDRGGHKVEVGDDRGSDSNELGDDHASGEPEPGDDHGDRGGRSGGGDDGGGPGASGGGGSGSGNRGPSQDGTSSHGGGSFGSSNSSGHGGGGGDDLAATQGTDASSGPGPGEERQPPPVESGGSGGGPGPSGESGSGGGSESGGSSDGSGSGDDHIDD
ncbi:MAG TPA: sigma-70 family RNA polymerase sigma factor [Solirubrobacterales bacterium]|nr:sigma-70 family RNA polymerase sigma factor [Solirubrobacterales bacterium]